jgi:hypothetical protein
MIALPARCHFKLVLWFLPLLIALLLASDAPASFPGSNGKIAFERNGGIWSLTLAGFGATNVTELTADGFLPAWSADGSKIAFYRGGDIYTMNSDGSGVTQVTSGSFSDTSPAWSPDGTKIAIQSNRAGGSQIFTVNADGTGVTQLTSTSGTNSVPDWSPDGQKIAFQSSRDGDLDIYTMNTDGTGVTQLTNTSNGDIKPTWSPTGTRIGFVACSPSSCSPGGNIFRVDADGSNLVQVTPSPGNTVFTATTPSWSPDATPGYIVYDNSQSGLILAAEPNGDSDEGFEVAIFGTEGYGNPTWQPIVSSYVRPIGATPIRDALVPAQVACAAPNATHEAPFEGPSCAPPQQASSWLTVGTPDVNGAPAKMNGSHKMTVQNGDPATAVDEADIALEVSVSDVRNKSNLSDYGGELEVVTNLRITDRRNGGFGPGTVTDFPFRYAVGCVPTASTTVGSTCSINTTADALFPNAVKEGKRSIWEVHGVEVFDGGSDGLAATQANTLFAVEGVFVP